MAIYMREDFIKNVFFILVNFRFTIDIDKHIIMNIKIDINIKINIDKLMERFTYRYERKEEKKDKQILFPSLLSYRIS